MLMRNFVEAQKPRYHLTLSFMLRVVAVHIPEVITVP